MTITIQASGGSEITLIDGPDRSQDKTCGPSTWQGTVPLSPQVVLPIGSKFAKPIERGGITPSGSFGGMRLCADEATAAAWIASHLGSVPRGGTLRFKVGGVAKFSIANAVITDIPHSLQGSTVNVAYNYTGGTVS
jgi:hypothetical protein